MWLSDGRALISEPITVNFLAPPRHICRGTREVPWAAMAKATIDEDTEPRLCEHEIGNAPGLAGISGEPHSKSHPSSVES